MEAEESAVRVLIIEDDDDDFFLIQNHFSKIEGKKFVIDQVSNYEEGINKIKAGEPDVCLIDFLLGERNGLELINEAMGSGCKIPLILLTGYGDHELDVKAMNAGAADYLTKGRIEPDLLERSIRYSIDRAKKAEELRKSEERLRQSQKMEAVGRMAAGIAHDFNNLLTVILGSSDLLLKELGASKGRKYVCEIKKAALRAASRTRQLLAFTRLSSVLSAQPLDLNAVVSDLEKALRQLLSEDSELVVRLQESLKEIKADRGLIEQALLNLVMNARDAMPQGGRLTIETLSATINEVRSNYNLATKPGPYVLLSVSDTGRGMDAGTLLHIFEPFFTTKVEGEVHSAGLGLAAVYGAAHQNNGYIEVLSEPGKGTIFKLYFPLLEDKEQTIHEPTFMPKKKMETILIVDDDANIVELAGFVLEEEGYKILFAHTAEEAQLLCKDYTETIDLIVADIVMPEMNGEDMVRSLRKFHPESAVLYMSGFVGESEEMIEQGAGFLEKPFSIEALIYKTREILDKAKEN